MWTKESIKTEIEAVMTEIDQDCIPEEQVGLLRSFELFTQGYITERERQNIDQLLLSDTADNIRFGVKLITNKIERHGLRPLETTGTPTT